jgi:putative heme iron utilization protein
LLIQISVISNFGKLGIDAIKPRILIMAADPITPAISNRICAHMNDDHAEAVLLYAKVYGKSTDATSATMVSIDPIGMDLTAEINGTSTPLRVLFDHTLEHSEDAHTTLVRMIKSARKPA